LKLAPTKKRVYDEHVLWTTPIFVSKIFKINKKIITFLFKLPAPY
jgi:hypothetical protein